jgi:DNA helicase-2/ATP-dependent DNA helicase PcrA
MSMNQHDWEAEKTRLHSVISEIRKQLNRLEKTVDNHKSEVVNIRRHFWDDITVNLDNADDLLETYSSITQQSMVLAGQERSYVHARHNIRKLEKLHSSPYFGRIDFAEKGDPREEQIYIGLFSLISEEQGTHLVYDWRAPISEMFYDYSPGPAEYDTPSGSISGEITLKRQYVIENGEMKYMFDTGLHIGDELLQQMLGKSGDDKMKSIVTTIQREQNAIIRNDQYKYLFVQGSAGSGKTSAALQRVAYLLYKHRNSMTEDNMVLFSPNSLFNDYVSNVLPELGENNMRQTTFQEYLAHCLGGDYEVQDPYDELEDLLTTKDNEAYSQKVSAMEYKASGEFLKVLDRYAELLKEEGMQFMDLTIKDKVILPAKEISGRFYAEASKASIASRIEKLKEWMLERLEHLQQEKAKKVYVRMLKQPQYLGTEKEMKSLSRKMARKRFAPVKESVKSTAFIDIREMYLRLFNDDALLSRLAEGTALHPDWKRIKSATVDQWESQDYVPYQDAAPFMYLKQFIGGFPGSNAIRHVIIDEAQDYSPLQFEILKRLFPRGRMTLLGDVNQVVYVHSDAHSRQFMNGFFDADGAGTIRLTKSYRSTREIVDFTRAMLPEGESIEAFSRSGDKPTVRLVAEQKLAGAVLEAIRHLRSEGCRSIAVICKTAAEALEAYERMSGGDADLHLISKDTQQFVKGTVVIPAYLSKGLEFDAVIIYNAGDRQYYRERERKLFYTACTRALHHLHLFYTGELTSFVQGIDRELFELESEPDDPQTVE